MPRHFGGASTYADEGDTTSECGTPCNAGHRKLYAWDEDGKLTQATVAGHLTRYLYDSGGQRVAKLKPNGPQVTIGQWWTSSGNSHATKHIFAGGQRIATKLLPAATVVTNMPPGNTPGGGWPNTNGCIPSGNQPQKCVETTPGSGVWVQQGNIRPATWYFHSDMLGSTGWLTTEDGEVHERVEYFPYGEVWRQSNGSGTQRLRQQFLYTGKEFDEETGLTYFGARYYDSRHARWLSTDPMLLGQAPVSLSAYHYSGQNPLKYRDADGNCFDLATNTVSPSCRGAWGYIKGVATVAVAAAEGTAEMIAPGFVDSLKGSFDYEGQLQAKQRQREQSNQAFLHPVDTFNSVRKSIKDTLESGDPERIGELAGTVVGTGALLASAKATNPLRGSGPAPGVLEVSKRAKSIGAFKNYYPRQGAIEYVFDPKSKTLLVGDAPANGSPHESLARLLPEGGEKPVGGTMGRGINGEFLTDEFSGHYWQNWTPEIRQEFKAFMESFGVKHIHAE